MQDELTSLMHMEFCLDEDERLTVAAMAIDGEVFRRRATEFDVALKKYSVTEEQFWERSTLTNVLDFPNTSITDLQNDYDFITKELYEALKSCKTKYEICYVYEDYLEEDLGEREEREKRRKRSEQRRLAECSCPEERKYLEDLYKEQEEEREKERKAKRPLSDYHLM